QPNEEMEEMIDKDRINFRGVTPRSSGTRPDRAFESIQANTLVQGFESTGQTVYTPPDNNVAVVNEFIVTVVNSTFSISDKCGNNLYENTINNFLGDGGFLFDPKVFYDPWRGRYSMLWLKRDDAAKRAYVITVSSDDSDPFGTWFFYYFEIDDSQTTWT